MHTLKLKINDQVYDKLIGFLGKFKKGEVEISQQIATLLRRSPACH